MENAVLFWAEVGVILVAGAIYSKQRFNK
jgi:hypothetical protein